MYLHGKTEKKAFEYAFLSAEPAFKDFSFKAGDVLRLPDKGLYAVCSVSEGKILVKKLSSRKSVYNHVLAGREKRLKGVGYVYGELSECK